MWLKSVTHMLSICYVAIVGHRGLFCIIVYIFIELHWAIAVCGIYKFVSSQCTNAMKRNANIRMRKFSCFSHRCNVFVEELLEKL